MTRNPDVNGHFGKYGGRYVAETLMPALIELEQSYRHEKRERGLFSEIGPYLTRYAGRPTPLWLARLIFCRSSRLPSK
jgi:tryptophan synthase beta chain